MSRAPLVAFLVLASAGPLAAQTQPLPIIVTYEISRRQEAAVVERRNPKAFWIRQIMARIEDRKPANTLGLAQPATTQVGFTIAHDGRLLNQSIVKSSGSPAVDKEATALLQRAQPFPPMPPAMSEADMSFALPLRFR